MSILQAAETWGVVPWEVRGQQGTPVSRLRWIMRMQFFNEQRTIKQQDDYDKAHNGG